MSSGKGQNTGKESDRPSKGKMSDKKHRKNTSGKSQTSKKESGSKRKTNFDRELTSSAVSVSSTSSSTSASNQHNKRLRGLEAGKEDKPRKTEVKISIANKSSHHDFLEFIDRVRNGGKDNGKVSGKDKSQPKEGAADAVDLAKSKVAEEQKKVQQRKKGDLGASTSRNGIAVASEANAQDAKLSMTMASQNRDVRELQLLNELRQQALLQSTSDESTSNLLKRNNHLNLFAGGMGNPSQAHLASAAAAGDLREFQLQQELRQQLLMQSQQASQFQASDLLQSNYGLQNYSALSMLQQQQQQQQQQHKDISDYLQLFNGGYHPSSLNAAVAASGPAAAAAAAGLGSLSAQEVDNAMLRASLAQSSLASSTDPELQLRLQSLKANGGLGAAEQLQLLSSASGLNPAAADDLALAANIRGGDPYASALSQYYVSGALSRMGENPLSGPANGLSSLAPSSLMSSLGSGPSPSIPPHLLLNPEVRAALLQEGGLAPNLLNNLGAHGM